MTLRYLLTGTSNDIESYFFLYIYLLYNPNRVRTQLSKLTFIDNANENKTIDENIKKSDIIDEQDEYSFLHCLTNIEFFINENNIKFTEKRLASIDRDNEIDTELERFINIGTTA